MYYGKLINFGSSSVEHRFITTTLTPQSKHEYRVINTEWMSKNTEWMSKNTEGEYLKSLFLNLLDNWGLFLDVSLYTQAAVELLGGESKIIDSVRFSAEGTCIGQQKFHMLNSRAAFKISAVNKAVKSYEANIVKLLAHTNLEHIQWINMNRHTVTFKTIVNPIKL